mmetsp:Transcript_4878/g.7288  ORF Transcript_4878/g.7288 Transcript_4878/m.7288 type:complete len:93 (-) Transcript_4878:328-606(-)
MQQAERFSPPSWPSVETEVYEPCRQPVLRFDFSGGASRDARISASCTKYAQWVCGPGSPSTGTRGPLSVGKFILWDCVSDTPSPSAQTPLVR